jgi:hypothetical protein
MSLQRDVSQHGLRPSFVTALAKKGITSLYEWQAAALREAKDFQGQNFIYQVLQSFLVSVLIGNIEPGYHHCEVLVTLLDSNLVAQYAE